jgi:signal transduction histidine kinase/ActR/RegA family two-component response regulator
MSVSNMPCRLRNKARQLRQVLLSVELFDLEGEPFLLTLAQDITEQLALEGQLRQSQKMEAVGQLAAGVAHDFNNILAVVKGYAGLLLADMPLDSKDRKPLQTIAAAADKASKLVRQLLTFSRKQVIQLQPVPVHATLSALAEMLPRVLGENIQVKVRVSRTGPLINADSGMLEQLLMNLAVNARDAMPDGGLLTISAEVVELNSSSALRHQDARPGQFMRLSVTDTGCGIPAEHLSRIFEPFFTTKPVGSGTGLGLAAVYGIAKQHNGWVEVQSQPGQGSTFQVFIPTYVAVPEKDDVQPRQPTLKGGNETILVAEDDDDVREFVVAVLKSYGYNVIAASSGKKALERWSECTETVHLLLTDMVMPEGLTGRQLAEVLLTKDPALRVLFTSGYSPGMAGKDLALLEGRDFLAKPYEAATLVQRVRACLDGPVQTAPHVPETPVAQVA